MTSVFRTIDPQQQSPKNRSTLAQGSDPLQNEVGFPTNLDVLFLLLLGMLCKVTHLPFGPIRRYPECNGSRLQPNISPDGQEVLDRGHTHTQTDNADTANLSYIGPPLRS